MIEQSEIRVKEAFFAILGHRRSFAVFKRSSGGSKVVSLSGLPHWRGRIFHRSGHFFTFIYLSFLHKKQGSRTRRSASKFWIDPKPKPPTTTFGCFLVPEARCEARSESPWSGPSLMKTMGGHCFSFQIMASNLNSSWLIQMKGFRLTEALWWPLLL